MFGKIFIFTTLLAVALSEVPVSAPYGPSGWRPQGATFDLPTEFFTTQAQRAPAVELEITKERVDYAGQLSDSNAGLAAPSNNYLPPSSLNPNDFGLPSGVDILSVQGLPNRPSVQFNGFRTSQLNSREYYPQRQIARFRIRPQKLSGNTNKFVLSRQTLNPVKFPSTQYGAPVVQPSTQYGAPEAQPIGYPDPRTPEANEEIIDGTVTKGEYFVLTPEKTLQKVSYKTSQTEEEARVNGFTAELKYTPVDKIDGPLYKYNEQGQLVRINKK